MPQAFDLKYSGRREASGVRKVPALRDRDSRFWQQELLFDSSPVLTWVLYVPELQAEPLFEIGHAAGSSRSSVSRPGKFPPLQQLTFLD